MADEKKTDVVEVESAQFSSKILLGAGNVGAVSSTPNQKLFLRNVHGLHCLAILQGAAAPRYVPIAGNVTSFVLKGEAAAIVAARTKAKADLEAKKLLDEEERREMASLRDQATRDRNRANAKVQGAGV